MTASFVYDAVRTPFGRYGKALSGVRPDDLAALVLSEIVARHPELDPAQIDDVILGDANAAGEDNRNVGRMASLLAGFPTSVPGSTVNRLCGSGVEAIIQASRAIETGDAELILAGGVESMSRAPWVLLKPSRGFPSGHETLHSTTLGWRMVNPQNVRPVDGAARRDRRDPRRPLLHHAASSRTNSPSPATSRPPPPGTLASTTARSSPCPARRSAATRASGPTLRSKRSPG